MVVTDNVASGSILVQPRYIRLLQHPASKEHRQDNRCEKNKLKHSQLSYKLGLAKCCLPEFSCKAGGTIVVRRTT